MKTNERLAHASKLRREAEVLRTQGQSTKALEFISYSALLGDRISQKKFARIRRGETTWYEANSFENEGNIEAAKKLYRRGARLGNATCMISLALLLRDEGTPKKLREMISWYKRGIKAGSAVAAYNLGIHYRNIGETRWYRHWMNVSRTMDEPDAAIEIRNLETRAKASKAPRAIQRKGKTARR